RAQSRPHAERPRGYRRHPARSAELDHECRRGHGGRGHHHPQHLAPGRHGRLRRRRHGVRNVRGLHPELAVRALPDHQERRMGHRTLSGEGNRDVPRWPHGDHQSRGSRHHRHPALARGDVVNSVATPEKVVTDIVASNGAVQTVARPVNHRLAWVALAYLAFMVPLTYLTLRALTYQSRLFDAGITAQALGWLGIPVLRDGVMLHLPNMTLEVADDCSSVPAIAALLALGAAYSQV